MKRFKFPIRTTPEGSIDPYKDKPKADMSKISESGFFTENSIHKADASQLICK